ncbi:MAG: bactofilin family protein [Patescibacteria group bacterium]
MFKDHDDENFSHQEGDTVIGHSIKIEGDLTSQGNIVVEGQVVGSVKTDKHLSVGQQAKVDAQVSAGEATVSGEVNGNITVTGKLELAGSARVNGDITVKVLKVEEGASINGKVEMEGGRVPVSQLENSKEKNQKKEDEEVDF